MRLWWEKLACPAFWIWPSQPPQPIEMRVYEIPLIWLCAMLVRSAYPTSMATPPWNSVASPEKWLSAIVLRPVRSALPASGRSSPPSCRPLPAMSVNTQPLTVVVWGPSPRSSPAAPRWTKPSPRNETLRVYRNDTLPGVGVQLPYGQVPPETLPHKPCVFPAPVPVSDTVACTSDSPSPLAGRSQVAYENWMPENVRSWIGALAVPCPETSVSRTGATTLAVLRFSPPRGR